LTVGLIGRRRERRWGRRQQKLLEIVGRFFVRRGEQPGESFAFPVLHRREARSLGGVISGRGCRTQRGRSRSLTPLARFAEVLRNLLGEYGRIAAFRFCPVPIATTFVATERRQYRSIAVCAAGEERNRQGLDVRGSGPELMEMVCHRRFLLRWEQRSGEKYVRNAAVERLDGLRRRRRHEQFRAKVCARHGGQLGGAAAIGLDGNDD
jgi:hypothetical protein